MSLVPPGVVPNYSDPPDHNRQTIILHTICLTLVTSAVSMRVYTRFFITRSGGIDDYFIIFSWAATVAWSGALIGSENYGIGRHLWDIPPNWLVPGLKLLFVTELMYTIIAPATKLSFLLCFLRIFHTSRTTQYFIWFGVFAIVVFYTVTFFDTLFLCKPMAVAWDPFLKGTCQSQKSLPYASGIFGIISDFYILVLPIPTIWSLNMPTWKKMRLMLVFGIGLFACVASVIRFVYTLRLVNNSDETWDYIVLSVWAVLEVDVGIICSCLHALPAFMRQHIPEKWRSYMYRVTSYFSLSHRTQRRPGAIIRKPGLDNDSYQNLKDSGQGEFSPKQKIYAEGQELYWPSVNRKNEPHVDIELSPLRDTSRV